MTPAQLEEIRKRAEAATAGPWVASFPTGRDHQWFEVETDEENEKTIVSADPEPSTSAIHPSGLEDLQERVKQHKANVTFIAHSRTDVVDLLAEVERLRGLLITGERMQQALPE